LNSLKGKGREFLRTVSKDDKDKVPSFLTKKDFLVATLAQLSQQIWRFLITEMNFCEKLN
jgi:hypothetical protein